MSFDKSTSLTAGYISWTSSLCNQYSVSPQRCPDHSISFSACHVVRLVLLIFHSSSGIILPYDFISGIKPTCIKNIPNRLFLYRTASMDYYKTVSSQQIGFPCCVCFLFRTRVAQASRTSLLTCVVVLPYITVQLSDY